MMYTYSRNQIKHNIMTTRPCGLHPLTPHFYIVKLGFTDVYFFIFALKHKLWVLVGNEAVLTCNQDPCFEAKIRKYQKISAENYSFTAVKICSILHRRVIVMSFNIEH